MPLTRRQALVSGAAAIATTIAKPAIAAKEPILICYLPALTGPSSSTGVGMNRGNQLAIEPKEESGGGRRASAAERSAKVAAAAAAMAASRRSEAGMGAHSSRSKKKGGGQ